METMLTMTMHFEQFAILENGFFQKVPFKSTTQS